MKKTIFRIIALVLCIIMSAGITVSAKSSESFSHYSAVGTTLTAVGRDMYIPVKEVTDLTLGQEMLEGATDIFAKDDYIYLLNGEKSKLFVLNSDFTFNREIIIKTEDGSEVNFKGTAKKRHRLFRCCLSGRST